MKTRRCHSGSFLLEMLIAAGLALLISAAMIALLNVSFSATNTDQGQNTADAGARVILDTLADNVRNAQAFKVQTNPDTYAVLSAAAVDNITVYTDSTGNTVRYWLDTTSTPYSLKKTQTSSGIATTTTILSQAQSVKITYYMTTNSAYNLAASSFVTTANPNAPTSAEMPAVVALQITVQATVNGYTRQLSSFIRLRNSPYKSSV
ncbi:MAG: hypothetical protein JWL77_996 [Chthonomonadaceae bacterium]|nr:hypothetical protein [Chthonomonadaceae bacterium]